MADAGFIGQLMVGFAQLVASWFNSAIYGGHFSLALVASGVCLIFTAFKWGAIMKTLQIWVQVGIALLGLVLILTGVGIFSVGGS